MLHTKISLFGKYLTESLVVSTILSTFVADKSITKTPKNEKMKKFFILAIMAVAAITASAQQKDVTITPHLGIGYSHLYNMPKANNDANAFSVGAEAEYMLDSKLGVSAGVDLQYVLTEEHQSITYGVAGEW